MSYILLPSINYDSDINFFLRKNDQNDSDIFNSHSLYYYLNNIKENITLYPKSWDFYKKITNPYEYIHTHVLNKTFSVSKYKPLSRSFFKMIEIINVFDILNDQNNIKSFHLAEGPGGFIEAFNYFRKNTYKDIYYGITLISNNQNIPSWKKAENYIKNNNNIKLEYGESKDGDLFNVKNIKYFNNNYFNSMEYITADGGFDFSVDFNNQETLSYKLIISQILYALIIQKKNGTFILKIFDIFKYKTIELIYLLSIFYDLVYIYKPSTSRIANSEKYLICKNFKGITDSFVNKILNNFENIILNSYSFYSIFNFSISKNFLYKIKEVNAIYGQQQLENINTTLNFIREINNLKTLVTNDNIFNSESSYFFLKDIEILELLKMNIDTSNNNFINDLYNISLDKHIFKSNIYLDTYQYEKYIKSINKINNKLLILLLTNVQKCITWSAKYNIEINKSFIF